MIPFTFTNNSCLFGCQESVGYNHPLISCPHLAPLIFSLIRFPEPSSPPATPSPCPFPNSLRFCAPKLSFTKLEWYSRCLLTKEPRDQLSPLVSAPLTQGTCPRIGLAFHAASFHCIRAAWWLSTIRPTPLWLSRFLLPMKYMFQIIFLQTQIGHWLACPGGKKSLYYHLGLEIAPTFPWTFLPKELYNKAFHSGKRKLEGKLLMILGSSFQTLFGRRNLTFQAGSASERLWWLRKNDCEPYLQL